MQIKPKQQRSTVIQVTEGDDTFLAIVLKSSEGQSKNDQAKTVISQEYLVHARGQNVELSRTWPTKGSWFEELLTTFAPASVIENGGDFDWKTARGKVCLVKLTVEQNHDDEGKPFPPRNQILNVYPVKAEEHAQALKFMIEQAKAYMAVNKTVPQKTAAQHPSAGYGQGKPAQGGTTGQPGAKPGYNAPQGTPQAPKPPIGGGQQQQGLGFKKQEEPAPYDDTLPTEEDDLPF